MLQSLDRINNRLNRILQLVYLNFLWGGLVIAGLGVFTFGPATYAMVAVIRKQLRSEESFPLTKTYFAYFKESYRETLFMSWIYGIVGVILFVDLSFVHNWYLRMALLAVAFLYLLSALYIFPIMAHYNWKGYFFKIKMAFLFGFSQLHYSLVLMVSLAGIYLVIFQIMPGVLTFMGGSFFFFAVTWTANQIFYRLEWKNSYIEKTEENKKIIQLVKEKIYEKSNARKIRS
ncbi:MULTISPECIES: DUF624 domain-containing protein [unclassified Enterococcus]|uniref:YesL family protein n=1 Tax=unclassified Enterococcus TaxID=2608891 RepID=UPI0013EE1B65|nr:MULTISPECIES: DUF624 domain-containing protein [unclassified Enterococcus]